MNTTFYLNCIAGNLFHTKSDPAIPAEYYVGLSKSAPNMNGGGVSEPSANAGYKRIKLTNLSQPTDGTVTNEQIIEWDESTANWGTVTHYVIYDSQTVGEGNLLMYGELDSPHSVEILTIMTIKEGEIKLKVQNPQ